MAERHRNLDKDKVLHNKELVVDGINSHTQLPLKNSIIKAIFVSNELTCEPEQDNN